MFIVGREKYQNECVKKCNSISCGKGIIILPTGAGKTVIALSVVRDMICKNHRNITTTLIFVPRLILGAQWIIRASEFLLKRSKLPIAFINVNSGGISNKIREMIEQEQFNILGPGVPKIPSTTDSKQLTLEINKLAAKKHHIVIVSTYHSSNVVREVDCNFDLSILDECQYLVNLIGQETEFRDALKINVKRQFSFTATPRITESADGIGMNNSNNFGKVIFERKPKEVIDAGAIVGPKMHIVGCEEIIDEGDYNNRMDMIFEGFIYHKQQVKTASAIPNHIGAKILVVCDGQMTIHGIFNSQRFKEIRRLYPKIRIYGLSTSFGIYIDNKIGGCVHIKPPITGAMKEEFLTSLYEMKNNEDAIIFHYDMIAEGIDVPGITGMLPLRNCKLEKFLQNLGRSTRLHQLDAQRICDGSLIVGDWENYIKPNCYVILPYCISNREDFIRRYMRIVESLRTEYGFDPSTEIIVDIINAAKDDLIWDEDELKNEIRNRVSADINEYYHLQENKNNKFEEFIFDEKIGTLTFDQKMDLIKAAARRHHER